VNHLAYCRRASSATTILASVLMLVPFGGIIACTAGVRASGPGTAGTTGSSGAAGSTGKAGTHGSTGIAGTTGSDVGIAGTAGTANPDAAACQTTEVKFLPQIPDVYVLVDRSGSEFDQSTCSSTTMSYTGGNFFTLKTAVLQVVQNLQDQVRFGFGSFVGDHATGACVPELTPMPSALPINLYNYSAINTLYAPLGSLSPCGAKADTPAVSVIPNIKSTLLAEPATAVNPMTGASYNIGKKYLLFVTDSETDFCDDGEALCPADAVTWRIQDLYSSGIGTLVIGLPASSSSGDTIAPSVLQNFANAGAGQPVAVPTGSTQTSINGDCHGNSGWGATWSAANPTANVSTATTPIATYAPTGGTAQVYVPTSATDVQALTNQITTAIQGVKSCTFDLPSTITVDLKKLTEAGVLINGVGVPLDPSNANGWDMVTTTELQLFGPACDTWRNPSSTDIKFNFPCDIIICIDNCLTN
jgi:hypothetical protein